MAAATGTTESYTELQARYEDLLRGERYDFGDRIS
eukprot:CAMPEP_0119022236 /NCGR_PEP_ID=MMETSP1176-20130426/27524_1 /TAXON_ID=265551 /ORGANISM="Synedropsis recta cf, Strain CCMP1620" /LENGTH=34 /DNA_ID= /DNA_START= /DNA_END= /DNA_ORIENTATION=